jgi:misacylated tRNA(Ala) deacylase
VRYDIHGLHYNSRPARARTNGCSRSDQTSGGAWTGARRLVDGKQLGLVDNHSGPRHRGRSPVNTSVTEALFQSDAYRRSCQATVLETGDAGVVLDRTVFYPTGGGQPGDTGTLRESNGGEWRIVDTRKGEGGRIVHVLASRDADDGSRSQSPMDGPPPGTIVEATIDWERRHAHMRMHTCLHLLGSVLRYGVTGGQIAADKGRLDFDTQDEIDRDAVTTAVNALVSHNHPVRSIWITDEDLDRQPELVRTLSVQPPRGAGRIRLLEIPGVDLQPCGGTHVASTGEIGPVVVSRIESKGRRNRRVYIAFV